MVAEMKGSIDTYVGKLACGHFGFKLVINHGDGTRSELLGNKHFKTEKDAIQAGESHATEIHAMLGWSKSVLMPENQVMQ